VPPNASLPLQILDGHFELHVARIVVDVEVFFDVQQPRLSFFSCPRLFIKGSWFNLFKFSFKVVYFFSFSVWYSFVLS
jgi:hypothetical protein